MTSISAASASIYKSPLQKLQAELQSQVTAGAISSSDQDALSSALSDIDSSIQSGRSSDRSSGGKPGDIKSRIDDLISNETQAGAWAEQLILTFRIYLNKSGHEANQGIRVLTGITAVTLPVILIGGWFGMNFRNMHELSWAHGYLVAAALTFAGTAGMLIFLRKKKWL